MWARARELLKRRSVIVVVATFLVVVLVGGELGIGPARHVAACSVGAFLGKEITQEFEALRDALTEHDYARACDRMTDDVQQELEADYGGCVRALRRAIADRIPSGAPTRVEETDSYGRKSNRHTVATATLSNGVEIDFTSHDTWLISCSWEISGLRAG